VGDAKGSFHEMLEALGASKAPLSVRLDVEYVPGPDELQLARRAIGHVMADAEVRGRLAALKVEPLVRAASIVLEDVKRAKAPRAQREVAESVCEYLDALDRAFGPLPSVLNNRGLARTLKGDAAGAAADFASARRLAPGFLAPRINEVALLRKKGDFALLEKVAEEIEAADPGNTEALRALLDAKAALRRPQGQVLPLALRLREANAARPSDLMLLGSLADAAGKPEEAERYLREYIALDPKEAEGHVRLATALLEQGKFADALGVYERLTEIDGPKHEYLLAIALVYDQMERVADAENAFEFALDHASARDQEIIERTFEEFRQRRAIPQAPTAPAPAAQPAPPPPSPAPRRVHSGPFAVEEADLALPGARGPAEPEGPPPDLETDEFAPKTVGETEIFGISGKEEPIFPNSPEALLPSPTEPEVPLPLAAEAPPPVAAEPAPPQPLPTAGAEPAQAASEVDDSRNERIARALEASESDAEAAAEIMGDEPAVRPALAADVFPQAPAAPPPPRPRERDALTPEEAPPETQAIVVAISEAMVPKPAEPAPPALPTPVVSAPAPSPPDGRPELPLVRAAGPVVSAPPPASEPVDDELAAELEALASSASAPEAEAPSEPEPFRRPTFDVDHFMEALEAKTKPVFDHLYDGMMEARRRDGPETQLTASLYESAPPTERPSVQAAPASQGSERPPAPSSQAAPAFGVPAPPSPVETPPPTMPALFREPAKQAILEAAAEATPHDASLLPRAEELVRDGNDPAAGEALDAYLRGAPDDARAWNLKGDILERAGDEGRAIASYRQAVKYDAGLREAWNNLGVLLHLGGRFEEAAQAFEAAVRAAPDDRHLWHNLGSTYHELGRLDNALSAFDRAIQIDPSDKVSHNNKGTTLFELGNFAEARASFDKAASLDPRFEQAFNNLGRTLERLDDREGAVKSFETALALNAASRTALKNLARVLRALGRAGDAAAAETRLSALGT